MTASRFFSLVDRDDTSSRVFATGDLVSLQPNGSLRFHGRRDGQVKIRGQRVDIDGVQAGLNRLLDGQPCIALTITPEAADAPILVALVEGETDSATLRRRMGEEVTAVMVPSFIWPVETLPRLPNGKVDRRAAGQAALLLFAPLSETKSDRSLTPTEQKIADIWARFLPVSHISAESDFFSLGGHSLLAVRVLKQLNEAFGTSIALRSLMRSPQLQELAKAVESPETEDVFILKRYGTGVSVLSHTQRRLLFLESQAEAGLYHFPVQFTLSHSCTPKVAAAALKMVTERHDIFRLPQLGAPDGALETLTAPADQTDTLVREHALRPFDLKQQGAIRALLILPADAEAHKPILAVVMHHIVTDAWSTGIFIADFCKSLDAVMNGGNQKLQKHPVSWSDYVQSVEAWLEGDAGRQHRIYWAEALKELPPRINWPGNYVTTKNDFRPADWQQQLDTRQSAALKRLAQEKSTTAFAVILATLNLTLHRLTGSDAILIGTASANRDHPDCTDMLGVFANTLPVLTRPSETDTSKAWLEATITALKGALAWPWLPLDQIVDTLPEASRKADLFQVFCNQLPTDNITPAGIDGVEIHQTVSLGCEFDLMLFFQTDGQDKHILKWRCRDAVLPEALRHHISSLFIETLDLILHGGPEIPAYPAFEPDPSCMQTQHILATQPSVIESYVAHRLDAEGRYRRVAYVVPNGTVRLDVWQDALCRLDHDLGHRTVFSPIERLPRDSSGHLIPHLLADCPAWNEQSLANLTTMGQEMGYTAQHPASFNRPPADTLPIAHRWELALSSNLATVTPEQDADEIDTRNTDETTPSLLSGPPLVFAQDAPRSLTGYFDRAANGSGALIAVDGAGNQETLSYSDLRHRALKVLTALREHGIEPGDRVFLLTGSPVNFFTGFWACLFGGFIACPFPAPKQADQTDGDLKRLVELGNQVGVKTVLAANTDHLQAAKIANDFGLHSSWLAIPTLLDAELPPAPPTPSDSNAVALLLFTSGSTDTPKAVKLSQGNLVAMAEGLRQRNRFSAKDGILNWMPLEHIGVLGMLSAVSWLTGATQVHVETGFVLADPLRWLDLLDRHRTAYSWAPHFAFALIGELAEKAQGRHWDLNAVKCLLNGGEAVIAGGVSRFLAVTEAHGLTAKAISPSWGMSETSSSFLICLGVNALNLRADPLAIVGVGTPHPGAEARLVDQTGNLVPMGEEGLLEVRGPQVNHGYWADEDATRKSRSDDGWFRTGDRARFAHDDVVITGRAKEVIILNGQNFSQQAIESALEELADITTTCVAAVSVPDRQDGSEKLAIFFHSDLIGHALADRGLPAIREKLRTGFGIVPDYTIPIAPDDFPKTAIGKIQRAKLRAGFIAKRYDDKIIDIDKLEAGNRTLPLNIHQVGWVGGTEAFPCPLPSVTEAGVQVFLPTSPAEILPLAQLPTDGKAIVITRNAVAISSDEVAEPAQAACLHLIRNLALERDDLCIRALDIGRHDDVNPIIEDETAALLSNPRGHGTALRAVRKGKIYQQALIRHPQQVFAKPALLRRNGTYVVTGGSGAAGHCVVNWLLRNWGARVLVIGRRDAPSDDTGWNALKLTASQTEGAALSYLSVAAPDLPDQVRRYGGSAGLDGLFHLSGLYRQEFLDKLEAEDLQEQLAAKVDLLTILSNCIEPGMGRMIIAFSSTLTLLGAAGSGAYLAANAALEAETSRLAALGHHAVALQWSAWTDKGRGIGLSADHDGAIAAQTLLGLKPLDYSRAIDLLELATRLPSGVHAMGVSPEGARLSAMMVTDKAAPYQISLEVCETDVDTSSVVPSALAGEDAKIRIHGADTNRASGLTCAHSSRFESIIRDCWAETLEMEIPISADSSFFELGGTSIRLFQMHELLQERTHLTFPQVQLFRHTTIAELTAFLMELTASGPKPQTAPQTPQKTAAKSRASLRKSARNRPKREKS